MPLSLAPVVLGHPSTQSNGDFVAFAPSDLAFHLHFCAHLRYLFSPLSQQCICGIATGAAILGYLSQMLNNNENDEDENKHEKSLNLKQRSDRSIIPLDSTKDAIAQPNLTTRPKQILH
ncbi:hypothetical protein [Coleofasciculus sp. FACHB-129]|uniref:hypothetical protein n=1 Tax=Cyanophyceae TaxID=3028117 RepID=UPI00168262F4|nr:hypothetical protein [Coleofasciculus sp. FACHB-129]MBD1897262.1 hypothetical protein [Coleofasciculus sp. FACHB-129]